MDHALREWGKKADGVSPRKEGPLAEDERMKWRRIEEENRVLKMETDLLKIGGLIRERDEVKFRFIDAEKANFPIDFMCKQFGVSRSDSYAFMERLVSPRERDDIRLSEEVKAVHRESRGAYGCLRVHAALKRISRATSRKRVASLMREQGLAGRIKKPFRRTTDSNHAFSMAENVLDRNFIASAPNKAWVTDITYVGTRERWRYVSAIVDLSSRMVVGWAMSERIDRQLYLDALSMAVTACRPMGA